MPLYKLRSGSFALEKFSNSPDMSVKLDFNGSQRRLNVMTQGTISRTIVAVSGGGQTGGGSIAKREKANELYGTHVPQTMLPMDPQVATSRKVVSVRKEDGKYVDVPRVRGGVLPPGIWIAVARGADGYRNPNKDFGAKYMNWWLYPLAVELKYADAGRELWTFYIHVTGFLGSDGCIVVDPNGLNLLNSYISHRRYTLLHSSVFEYNDADGGSDFSRIA